MRVKNTTQRFEAFVREMQESFWGDFQGRTRETLQKLLEAVDEVAQSLGRDGGVFHERQGFGIAFHRHGKAKRSLAQSLATILAPLYEDIRDTFAGQNYPDVGSTQLAPGQA